MGSFYVASNQPLSQTLQATIMPIRAFTIKSTTTKKISQLALAYVFAKKSLADVYTKFW